MIETREYERTHRLARAAVAMVIFALGALAWAQAPKIYVPDGLPLPTAVGVWNATTLQPIAPGRFTFGDPPAVVKAVRIVAPRNGVASGQVVVAGPDVLTGVSAKMGACKRRDGADALPPEAATIHYAAMRSAQEMVGTGSRPHEFNYCFDLFARAPAAAIIPVWVTVAVPRAAAPGVYDGELTLAAAGKTWRVPVEVQVSAWQAPDPRDWVTRMDLVDSPESEARMYRTPLYSDAHFAKIEKALALMGQLGNKTCWVPLIAGGMWRSDSTPEPEQSMVRYAIKDGKVEMDFTAMDRYLDLFQKYCGEPISIDFYVWHSSGIDIHPRKQPDVAKVKPFTVTGMDGKPIEIRNFTPEAEQFWKQVMDAVHARIVRRGWSEKCIMLGLAMDVRPSQPCVEQMRTAAPYATWVLHAHDAAQTINGVPVGYCANFRGGSGYFKPGWTNPEMRTIYPYDNPRTFSPLPYWRYVTEVALRSGFRGLGRIGADHWRTAITDPVAGPRSFRSQHWVGGQSTMQLSNYLPALFAAGPDGAEPSVLFETLREGVQEAEARIQVENALASGKLPADLAKQCANHLAKRGTPIRAIDFPIVEEQAAFAVSDWQDRLTIPIFDLAAKVNTAMNPEGAAH
jgi:hypothetical protein